MVGYPCCFEIELAFGVDRVGDVAYVHYSPFFAIWDTVGYEDCVREG